MRSHVVLVYALFFYMYSIILYSLPSPDSSLPSPLLANTAHLLSTLHITLCDTIHQLHLTLPTNELYQHFVQRYIHAHVFNKTLYSPTLIVLHLLCMAIW